MANITSYGEKLRDNNPEAFEKLCKAMEKSNGKVNNPLGLLLAMSDTTTVDEVVKMASGIGSTDEDMRRLQPVLGYGYDNKPWKVESGRTKEKILNERRRLREERFQDSFEYNFEDTFLYRIMVNLGLSTKLEKEKGSWYRNTYSVLNRRSSKLQDNDYVQPVVMFFHTPKDLREIILSDENLNRMWTEQAKIQRSIYKPYSDKEKELHPITSTDEEWRKFQTTFIIREFGQIAHMPEDKKEEMNKWIEWNDSPNKNHYYGEEKLPPIVMHTILEGFRYPGEDKTIELVREAFEVMDYIGVGVCWNFVETETIESNPDGTIKYDENGKEVKKYVFRRAERKDMSYRVGAMLKHISSSMRKFAADVKKGFDVRDVRELVVEDLNGWAQAQARGHWQFFVRDDAPEEYPDLQKKKKSNRGKKQDIELNDTELDVINQFKEMNNKENKDGDDDES